MSSKCPVCKTTFHVQEEKLTTLIVKWNCEQCGTALIIHRDTGKLEAMGQPHMPDSELRRTPSPQPAARPSVAPMTTKGKGSSDRAALAVFTVTPIVFVIIAYGFLSRTGGNFIYSLVRSASNFMSDLERPVEGYLG